MNKRDTLVVAGAVVLVAGIFVVLPALLGEEDTDSLHLSCTKLSLGPDEEYELPVWVMPNGTSYGDITWSSEDGSVVTVDNGRVTATGVGTALVKAEVEKDGRSYSDTCRVTVSDGPVTREMTVYDPFSEGMDNAVLYGEGFEEGLLALAFNCAGCITISLPGYDESWILKDRDYIGNASSDFSEIDMVLKDSAGNTVSAQVYKKANVAGKTPENGGSVYADSGAYTALMSVEKPAFGEYTVGFSLWNDDHSEEIKVEGGFRYSEGDGLRDVSGTFCVNHAWKVCNGHASSRSDIRSFRAEIRGTDYWNESATAASMIEIYSNGAANHGEIKGMGEYVPASATLDSLAQCIREAYGTSSANDTDLAQFVLTFLQVRYAYAPDYIQYYDGKEGSEEGTDIWALPCMTIHSGYGDCEDTSILLGTLYRSLGFDAATIVLPSHMMAAVHLDNYTEASEDWPKGYGADARYDGKDYYFCETTVNAPVKQVITRGVLHPVTEYHDLTSFENLPHSGPVLGTAYSYRYYMVGLISKDLIGSEFTIYAI